MKLHGLISIIFLSLFGINFFTGCDGKQVNLKRSDSGDLNINVSENEISYASVKPLFNKYCVDCHKANGKPNFSIYKKAKSSASKIKSFISSKFMPQQGSIEAQAITDQERAQIINWVNAGAPLEPVKSNELQTSTVSEEPQSQLPKSLQTINQCMNCHGNNGVSPSSSYPNLAGQNRQYLKNQLLYFKSGQRKNIIMNAIAKDLTKNEISLLANFFSSLYPSGFTQQQIRAETYAQIQTKYKPQGAMTCIGCHANPIYEGQPLKTEDNPEGLPNPVPSISGQKMQYITSQFKNYYSGARVSPIMNQIAQQEFFMNKSSGELNIELINEIAKYFSQMPVQNINND